MTSVNRFTRSTGALLSLVLAAVLGGCMEAGNGEGQEIAETATESVTLPDQARNAPPFAQSSLYNGPAPRPGPDILYAEPPRAPQLENTGIWQAEPILISGASAYRHGEFLYQDYLYDDLGADGTLDDPNGPREGETFSSPSGTYTYPADRSLYGDNAADFVELRVRPRGNETAFRVTLNTLKDASKVAFTIAIGDSPEPREFPHGANVMAPAELFLTVHGEQARLLDAATGEPVTPAPTVSLDPERRQFEIRVNHAAWSPGREQVRLAAGAGLWDEQNQAYVLPEPTRSETQAGGSGILTSPPAFFNVAFRYNEPKGNSTEHSWSDQAQSEALASGDISEFHALVDFDRLHRRVNDDMVGEPMGVPAHGPMNRILASRFEPEQGLNFAENCGTGSDPGGCEGVLRGQLQPYALYLPEQEAPREGYGFTLLLHSLSAAYNQYTATANQRQFGERSRGHIVATPAGRGPDGWYTDLAEADVFEVWADVARHYPLDPQRTAVSGYSMGGYGTFRLAARYPDLFGKAFTTVGPPAQGIWLPPAPPNGGGQVSNTFFMLESMRHIPFMMWVATEDQLVPYPGPREQTSGFDDLEYRYEFWSFHLAEHLTLALNDEYSPAAEFLGESRVHRDPARITYAINPGMDYPQRGLVADHAYWLSDMTLRSSEAEIPRARIDAFSHGLGVGDPVVGALEASADLLTGGELQAMPYTREVRHWEGHQEQAVANRLDIEASNLSQLTVHPERAGLDCDAALNVVTDGPLTVVFGGCDRSETFTAF